MFDLISELKNEHAKITDTLRRVIELGINSEEGKDLLFRTKSYLLAHLKKEDVKLYPALWEAAETNSELKQTLDAYAKEMNAISDIALTFFNDYSSGGEPEQFARDYKRLFRQLNERIMKEESVLYKKYEEIKR